MTGAAKGMGADAKTRAGFVALIGAPNAGKSTLMNALVGAKVSIVTRKVQTTRARIRGIAMHESGNKSAKESPKESSQVIFIDTPGIFSPKRRLDRAMVRAAWDGAVEADMVVLVHDAARKKIDDDTRRICAALRQRNMQAALVLNKADIATREGLMRRAEELGAAAEFARVFMVSATKADGTGDLLAWLAGRMPRSPYYFDPEDISDMPARLLAAEIMREKLMDNLHEELPYQLTVETESWNDRADGSAEVRLSVLVARAGHRGIVLGRGGKTLGRIGRAARLELEEIFGRRIHLLAHVKHAKDWMNDPKRYHNLGLEFGG